MPANYPTPSRLKIARQRRALTGVALARLLELTPKSIYNFENAKDSPSDETLRGLAEALRFPVSFFFRPDIDSISPDSASFRSLRLMTAGQRDAALAAGAMAFELSDWIDQRFELHPAALPDLSDYRPQAAAVALREHWGIGHRPIGNMIHLLESKGVHVYSLAEQGRRVDAFSLWHRGLPFVLLNTLKGGEHGRMDAAHELAHLTMHRHSATQRRDIEAEARSFASEFLMPEESVRSNAPRRASTSFNDLVRLKRIWKVSVAALAYRLHSLQLVSDWRYRQLCIQISRYGRTKEPEGIGRETSSVFSQVFGGLGTARAMLGDAAAALGLNVRDVNAMLFGLSAGAVAETGRRTSDLTAASRRGTLKIV